MLLSGSSRTHSLSGGSNLVRSKLCEHNYDRLLNSLYYIIFQDYDQDLSQNLKMRIICIFQLFCSIKFDICFQFDFFFT